MSLTDPIAEALTIIRNAVRARKENAQVRASKIVGRILEILKKEGFIQDFRFLDDKKQGSYKVYLKYHKDKACAIQGIKRISRPGLRRYVQKHAIRKVYGGLGIAILSTPKGIMTDEEARAAGVGGELFCEVW